MVVDSSNWIAAFLVLTMGIFGVVCNFLIVYMFKTNKTDRSSFNLICVFRACINLFVLIATFLVCFLPTIILGYSIYPTYVEAALIIFSTTFYLGNEYQTILVAANRFCALFFPLHYSRFFGYRTTMIILLAMYGYRFGALVVEALFFFDETKTSVECNIFFSPEKLTWTVTDHPDCNFEDNILLIVSITFLIVITLNIAIFTKILIFQTTKTREGKRLSSKERKNIILFVQTVLQDSLYVIDLTFTFKLGGLSNTRMWAFISSSFIWESIHALDGLIMCLFNERLSILKSLFKFQPSAATSENSRTTPSTTLARVE